ncbi:MAG: cytochrome c [Bacteroidetes bacterium]|nr:cytochrome c [Bacteroidota bacterium]
MKKFLKWTFIVIIILLIIAIGSGFYLNSDFEKRYTKTYTLTPTLLPIPSDSFSIARGKHWADILCSDCHGNGLGGKEFFNVPDIGCINTPNITTGKGSKTIDYTDEDWIRVLRHGIKKNGQALFIMPSKSIGKLSDENLAQLIAYMKQITPVEKEWAAPTLTVKAKVLASLGAFGKLFDAETIDHQKVKNVSAPPVEANIEYGAYMISICGCKTCHGETLNGFKDPNPEAPFSPNISPGGNFGKWTLEQFITTFKTGNTPEGKQLNNLFMPFSSYSKMDTLEFNALYNYIKAQKALPDAKH